MRLSTFLALSAAALATPASAQPSAAPSGNTSHTVTTYLDSYDATTNSYSGRVIVGAQPCSDVNFSIILPVDHVRNPDEARNKVTGQIAKIDQDIREAAASCGRR